MSDINLFKVAPNEPGVVRNIKISLNKRLSLINDGGKLSSKDVVNILKVAGYELATERYEDCAQLLRDVLNVYEFSGEDDSVSHNIAEVITFACELEKLTNQEILNEKNNLAALVSWIPDWDDDSVTYEELAIEWITEEHVENMRILDFDKKIYKCEILSRQIVESIYYEYVIPLDSESYSVNVINDLQDVRIKCSNLLQQTLTG